MSDETQIDKFIQELQAVFEKNPPIIMPNGSQRPTNFYDIWETSDDVLDECRRVFFRLSYKMKQRYIPLWDVIDDRPNVILPTRNSLLSYPRKKAHNFIKKLFAQVCETVKPPVEYDPLNALFTMTDTLLEDLEQLRKAFADWEENEQNKTGKI